MNNYNNDNFPIQQTPSIPGQINGANDTRFLYRKLFAGEVLTCFKDHCFALRTISKRTLRNGKSINFPMISFARGAKYLKPGELIKAAGLKHTTRSITVDDVLASDLFISEVDSDLNHYDVRAPYTKAAAYEMANGLDKNVMRIIAKAAFITDKAAAEKVFGVGNVLDDEVFTNNVTFAQYGSDGYKFTRGQQIIDAIHKARTEFVKKNVPNIDTAVCILTPDDYEALVNAAQDINKMPWMNKQFQGLVSFDEKLDASGDNPMAGLKIAGIQIYETNHLPQQNELNGIIGQPEPLPVEEGGSGRTDAYRADFTGLAGLVYTKDCAAAVIVKDLSSRVVDEPTRLGINILTQMHVGTNILRPACAIALFEAKTDTVNERLPSFIAQNMKKLKKQKK
ncbi:capsid protein [Aeromonas hydrophila]|uniref:capsid protein n=1 Tax=Aeromonas hydrophila TaxID=644 RepID=UPI002151B076|nr:capsid protein [Aeromonas hydrophila]WRK90016.1 capsid protein [Aeromonas hydrophila]